jgi:hypothetical protein
MKCIKVLQASTSRETHMLGFVLFECCRDLLQLGTVVVKLCLQGTKPYSEVCHISHQLTYYANNCTVKVVGGGQRIW